MVVAATTAQRSSVELTNVDMLTARYLTLEKALWQVIRGGTDPTYIVQRIHDIHLTFFAEDFHEHGVPFELFDTDQKTLHSSINHINMTTDVVNDMYLQSKVDDSRRHQTIGFARYGINITQHMDKIFNITENNDFFQYIATVSFLCFSEYFNVSFFCFAQKGERQNCLLQSTSIQSTGQLLYEYYTDIQTAQLKGYVLAQLSFMFLSVFGIGMAFFLL